MERFLHLVGFEPVFIDMIGVVLVPVEQRRALCIPDSSWSMHNSIYEIEGIMPVLPASRYIRSSMTASAHIPIATYTPTCVGLYMGRP